jgi:hypothetical protein
MQIRSNKNSEGIKVSKSEFKINQLAHDTNCFIRNLRSAEFLFGTFNSFHKCSGLATNTKMTKAKYLGSLTGHSNHPFGLCWTEDPLESLGVIFVENEVDNYEKKN